MFGYKEFGNVNLLKLWENMGGQQIETSFLEGSTQLALTIVLIEQTNNEHGGISIKSLRPCNVLDNLVTEVLPSTSKSVLKNTRYVFV